jgi:ATP citrate (pro-S)-lyase
MSAKAIREASGKDLFNRNLEDSSGAAKCRFVSVDEKTQWGQLVIDNPWLETTVSVGLHIFIKL